MTARGRSRVAGASRLRARASEAADVRRRPVFAVVPSAAASWLLGRLQFAGVTEVAVRNEIAHRRGLGRVGAAAQLELAWEQLQAAAAHDCASGGPLKAVGADD
jgi:hypothetical protein